ncbi:hypothetical protein K432DRAFT_316165, partial [Lepidopterella palustris CBS 459.81]
EDRDPSHGNCLKNNVCARLKRNIDLLILAHPIQSLDLNPIKPIWCIIKQRLRGRKWSTVTQFKADIQAEWDKITITDIRKRIREMPWRCKRVQELNGKRIRTDAW